MKSTVRQGTMVAINKKPSDDTINGDNLVKYLKKNRRSRLTYKRINSVGEMPNTFTLPLEIPEKDREATENSCDHQSMKPARNVVTNFGVKYYKSHWMGIIDELLDYDDYSEILQVTFIFWLKNIRSRTLGIIACSTCPPKKLSMRNPIGMAGSLKFSKKTRTF
jgi:hypothetical protein